MVTAKALCEEQGLTYINGYNDAAIIAGQGTTALEILEQVLYGCGRGKVQAAPISLNCSQADDTRFHAGPRC